MPHSPTLLTVHITSTKCERTILGNLEMSHLKPSFQVLSIDFFRNNYDTISANHLFPYKS